MSRKTQIRLGGLGTALLASLALAPAALAMPDGNVTASGQKGPYFGAVAPHQSANLDSQIPLPPDRLDRLGTDAGRGSSVMYSATRGYWIPVTSTINSGVVAPPDRVDKLGTANGPRSVPATIVSTPSNGFDWTDALIGAGAALAAMLLAGFGVFMTRRHGGVAQPS